MEGKEKTTAVPCNTTHPPTKPRSLQVFTIRKCDRQKQTTCPRLFINNTISGQNLGKKCLFKQGNSRFKSAADLSKVFHWCSASACEKSKEVCRCSIISHFLLTNQNPPKPLQDWSHLYITRITILSPGRWILVSFLFKHWCQVQSWYILCVVLSSICSLS